LYDAVEGSVGNASFGVAKLNAEVRSPHTVRRHGVMLGSDSLWPWPKRASMKRITDV
jgi:hypothetical protein